MACRPFALPVLAGGAPRPELIGPRKQAEEREEEEQQLQENEEAAMSMRHRVEASRSQPLRTVFQAYCSRLGLQAPHARFFCTCSSRPTTLRTSWGSRITASSTLRCGREEDEEGRGVEDVFLFGFSRLVLHSTIETALPASAGWIVLGVVTPAQDLNSAALTGLLHCVFVGLSTGNLRSLCALQFGGQQHHGFWMQCSSLAGVRGTVFAATPQTLSATAGRRSMPLNRGATRSLQQVALAPRQFVQCVSPHGGVVGFKGGPQSVSRLCVRHLTSRPCLSPLPAVQHKCADSHVPHEAGPRVLAAITTPKVARTSWLDSVALAGFLHHRFTFGTWTQGSSN